MSVSKENLVDLEEQFSKVIKLIIEDSKLDPETEPFKSKCAARYILLGMEANLSNLLNHENDETQNIKFTAMLAAVYLYLGMVTIDMEELSKGEEYLDKCRGIVDHSPKDSMFIIITLNMYNQFGILWSQRDAEKAKTFLEKSMEFYKEYAKSSQAPIDIPNLFNSNSENDPEVSWANYDKTHTLTLYFLAQIYGALKDALKSSVYCHNTLKRQLKSQDFDPIDWALNSATLSQFFMEKDGFKQARHHLAASCYILDKYEEELNKIEDRNESSDAKFEAFKHRSADVARCWAKYGLLLLSRSRERLLSQTEDIDKTEYSSICSDLTELKLDSDATISQEDLQNLEFDDLDLTFYESQITYKFALTIQDARIVFLNIQNWLRKAENYYTLDNLASDHIEIIQDQSQMYLNLLFFEDSPETQAKLHKRRVDLLENIIKKISSQYYLPYCRQLWFELGQTYFDILNIKSDKLKESDERPTPHALTKINHLIERSIYYFTSFIVSFQDEKSSDKITQDCEKAYLQAYFQVAALSSRFITLDKKVQLENVEKSFNAYKKVVDYCEQNEQAKEGLSMEFGICNEMVRLLPVKMAKMRQEICENTA